LSRIVKSSDEGHRGSVSPLDRVAMVAKTLETKSISELSVSNAGLGDGTITLTDGTIFNYRQIQPHDESALQRFHDRLSGESVRLRFMSVLPHLSEHQAHYFTNLDGKDRFAFIALDPCDPTEIVAVARYDREPGTDRAEYAAVVADRWQGRGLGLALTRRLIEAARIRGVRSFYALVLPENIRMLNLLRDLGLPEQVSYVDQVERVEIELSESTSRRSGIPDAQVTERRATEAMRA
jgi:RimJ/RimL family protein N-acetyltransferase